MTDDIVTRLGTPEDCIRELLSGCKCTFIGDGNCRCCRAAEMIERLRYEVQRWKQLAKREIVICDPNDPCEMCKEMADD